ncbi:hypothetical protein DCAR_0730096 [Daucus carota subsp. sativus]|uniref:Uncharacterized protein n=1 Tax=Daucus carota subsp. sativus TaxID=79200 RepID=A0A161Y9H6_DAUCS|nr:PREDICTED: 4-coumarate--CoA ligase-like 9 [Daucus carota subsp. sativus]WOH10627.1 hypothetical protein DCAR_0730096 [Daucus carota subsp. sativus]
MASSTNNNNNGFCHNTKTFKSTRPPIPLPPSSHPLSITQYCLSLLNSTPTASSLDTSPFLIDAATGTPLSYSQFLHQSHSLSASLQSRFPSLSPNNVALILSPPSLHIPVLYFSLLSLNITISPANPLSTRSELKHIVQLTKPKVAFATSSTCKHIPSLPLGTVLIDSTQFISMLNSKTSSTPQQVTAAQSDSAAILCSSGTTGRVKGVELSHRNLISVLCGFFHNNNLTSNDNSAAVSLFTLPLFHVFGFFMLFRAFTLGECLVLMGRFDFETMLKTVEKYKVIYMPVSPPLVVMLAKSDMVAKYDLSSLRKLGCGGAALGKEISQKFNARFPDIDILQGYGMTETGGGATSMVGPDEAKHYGSAGRLTANMEAKIVDPSSGEALLPGKEGELWLKGPNVMKGYVGDNEATVATFSSDGWLKTGDICYFDSEGFLFIVDRLKELIKYKAYQVPPAELERVLHSIPGIADAAVIPYPDEEAGQIPMAYVVRSPGSNLSEVQIMDFVAKQVSPYKKIRRVAFINAIPRSQAGKILRRELVKHATSDTSAKL